MGLPLIDSTSGIFATGANLGAGGDDARTVLTGATLNIDGTNDIDAGKGSEVAFNLVDRIHTAVTAYNDSHGTDLAKITSSLSSSVSGDEMTRTYVLAFKVDVSSADLDVAAE